MSLTDKMINVFIERMSQDDKEKLIEKVIEKFLNDMTPEDKQKLIEKIIPTLLEGVDMKELLSYMMRTMWKGSGTDDDRSGILDTLHQFIKKT